jgi:hypothetical protein
MNRLRTIIGSTAALLYFLALLGLVIVVLVVRALPSVVWWRVLIIIAPIAAVITAIKWMDSERHQRAIEERDVAKYEQLRKRLDPHHADREAARQAELEATQTEIESLRREVESLRKHLADASLMLDQTHERLYRYEPRPPLAPEDVWVIGGDGSVTEHHVNLHGEELSSLTWFPLNPTAEDDLRMVLDRIDFEKLSPDERAAVSRERRENEDGPDGAGDSEGEARRVSGESDGRTG